MALEQLPDWLGRRARTDRDRPALIFQDHTWTFGELDRRVGLAAGALRVAGVRPDDRVALLAGNTPEFVVAVHAAARLGATLVPLNLRLTDGELAWQIEHSGAALLLHDQNRREQAVAAASGIERLELGAGWEAGADPVAAPDQIALDRIQGIIYTSGTTGRPKGAMISFGNFWASAVGSALHLGHDACDRWLAVLPLFHVGGLSILFRSVIGGAPVILHDGFDPAAVNRAIDCEGATLVSVVANMLQRMLDERTDRPFPKSLRCMLLGGGPAPDSLLARCIAIGAPVAPTYGLTESTSQVATLLPPELAEHTGSAGRALPVTEIRIERDGAWAAPGEHGEILVRGGTVIDGYLGLPARRADGWFPTGDIGWLDADGYLRVLDRRDDLIVSGGENVYPAEVESALAGHPDVVEAAVVGVEDPRWGAVPIAYVVRRPGSDPTPEDLAAHLAARLAGYKRPRQFVFVAQLPRNAGGKLLRRELRAVR